MQFILSIFSTTWLLQSVSAVANLVQRDKLLFSEIPSKIYGAYHLRPAMLGADIRRDIIDEADNEAAYHQSQTILKQLVRFKFSF